MRDFRYPLDEGLLALQERRDLRIMPRRARFLQAVDFPLDLSAFAVVALPFQGPDTIGRVGRGAGLTCNLLNQGSFCCT